MFTARQVVQLAEVAVREHGQAHIEPRGQYLRWSIEGNRWVPCCLVGHVAVAAGVEIARLVRVNSEAVTGTARPVLADTFTDHALDLLQLAQRLADKGATWGEILDELRLRFQLLADQEKAAAT